MSEKTAEYNAPSGTETAAPTANIRSAMTILPELRNGRTVIDLSGAIHEALAAVRQHGKKAVVTLELTIAPVTNQGLIEPAVVIVPEVRSKLPTETPDSTLFFIDADGNATRHLERAQSELTGIRIADSNP